MDFLDRVLDYLEGQMGVTFEVGVLGSNVPSYAIRQTPSTVMDRYKDKGKTYSYSFQILVKDSDQLNAIQKAHQTFNLLDAKTSGINSSDNSFTLINLECTTLPNFVEKNEHNEFMYTALFEAELI